MNGLRSIVMAFQMFTRIPMPQVAWKQENMQYMFAAFPLPGLVLGLLLWGWASLAEILGLGTLLFAAGLTLIPVLFTGGIHLDGFCDTMDALASHASPEKKRAILKDPHAGAFAVIGLAAYLLAYVAFAAELPRQGVPLYILCVIPVLSRSATGLAGIVFPPASVEGLQHSFHDAAKKRVVAVMLLLWLLSCAAVLLWLQFWLGLALLLTLALVALYVNIMSRKQFGGMSGDLSGYFLQLVELLLLAALVIFKGVLQ